MVTLAHAVFSFSGNPMVAHMLELARAILVKVLLRMNGILEIVSLAASSGIWRILFVPRFCLAFVSACLN